MVAVKRPAKKAAKAKSVKVTAKRRLLGNNIPVFVLPADAESVARMVSQAHEAIAADPDYAGIAHHQYLDLVWTVFGSIGIKAKGAK